MAQAFQPAIRERAFRFWTPAWWDSPARRGTVNDGHGGPTYDVAGESHSRRTGVSARHLQGRAFPPAVSPAQAGVQEEKTGSRPTPGRRLRLCYRICANDPSAVLIACRVSACVGTGSISSFPAVRRHRWILLFWNSSFQAQTRYIVVAVRPRSANPRKDP